MDNDVSVAETPGGSTTVGWTSSGAACVGDQHPKSVGPHGLKVQPSTIHNDLANGIISHTKDSTAIATDDRKEERTIKIWIHNSVGGRTSIRRVEERGHDSGTDGY